MRVVVIECPNCRQQIQLVDLRAGRFIPKCPHCGVNFELIVPEEAAQPARVARLAELLEPSTSFIPLKLPESAEQAAKADFGTVFRSAIGRLFGKLRRLIPGQIPGGIPRLLDEGHYLVLSQASRGFYGPMFRAIPWCGGALRTVSILPPDTARDPYYASRWVGEMIVASELIHPNLGPFEAVGETRGLFCAIKTLREDRPAISLIEPGDSPAARRAMASAMVLQAARGLKFAHEQGVYHRDLRPENLAINARGTVKVINFGLDSHPFLIDAERQRQLAIIADKKDVKSGQAPLPPIDRQAELDATLSTLGRTWIVLATDRIDALTAPMSELVQHTEAMPKAVGDVARKLLAPAAGERFANPGQIVEGLETALGIWSPEALAQREPLQLLVQEAGDRLKRDSNIQLRKLVLRIAAASWGALLLLSLTVRSWSLGINFLVLGLMTMAWIGAISEATRRPRSTLASLMMDALRGISAYALAAVALMVLIVLLAALFHGYLGTWLIFGFLSLGLALAFEVGVGRNAGIEWRAACLPVEKQVADLRLSGLREETLKEWFDSSKVTGLDALRRSLFESIDARENDVDAAGPGAYPGWTSVSSPIQDAARRFLIGRTTAHRDRRHRTIVTRVETDRLVARGVNRLTAIRRARRAGKAAMTAIADWRLTRIWDSATTISLRPDLKKNLRESFWQAIENPERLLDEHERTSHWIIRRGSSMVRTVLGRPVRLAAGLAILVLFALWLDREGIVTREHVRQAGTETSQAVGRAIENRDTGELRGVRVPLPSDHNRLWEAWNDPLIDREWSRSLSGFNLGLAGLVLLLSAFSERFSVGLFAILGASIILAGPVLARAELGGTLTGNTSAAWLIGGLVLAAIGLLVRPARREV